MLLALAGLLPASAQRSGRVMRNSSADSVLLSQYRDGDYVVCKYIVKHGGEDNNDFTVRYRINLATISHDLDENDRELANLKLFMDSIANDPTIHVKRVDIKGYASPDGVESSNLKLAYARAETLKNYLESRYGISNRYKVETDGFVEDWQACESALGKSNVAGRDKALAVIRGKEPQTDKQRALKAMPAVWNYLKGNVLPKLRYADVEFAFNRDEIVEVRRRVEHPKPADPPANLCRCCGEMITATDTFIEDKTNGLIVEMDDVGADWY